MNQIAELFPNFSIVARDVDSFGARTAGGAFESEVVGMRRVAAHVGANAPRTDSTKVSPAT